MVSCVYSLGSKALPHNKPCVENNLFTSRLHQAFHFKNHISRQSLLTKIDVKVNGDLRRPDFIVIAERIWVPFCRHGS